MLCSFTADAVLPPNTTERRIPAICKLHFWFVAISICLPKNPLLALLILSGRVEVKGGLADKGDVQRTKTQLKHHVPRAKVVSSMFSTNSSASTVVKNGNNKQNSISQCNRQKLRKS